MKEGRNKNEKGIAFCFVLIFLFCFVFLKGARYVNK